MGKDGYFQIFYGLDMIHVYNELRGTCNARLRPTLET